MNTAENEPKNKGIYGLTLMGDVFYVGQSVNIKKRYAQHCSVAQNRGNLKKNILISELLNMGITPGFILLEATENLNDREKYWIKHYRSIGQAFANLSDGSNDMSYPQRAKNLNPWGTGWSPVKRRLIAIKSSISILKKYGNDKSVDRLEKKLFFVNKVIEKVGLKEMNMRLWRKYGKA